LNPLRPTGYLNKINLLNPYISLVSSSSI
jgi:hypothetical protein